MAEIQVEDGVLDCPKYGVIGELRCSSSCKWFVARQNDQVQCKKNGPQKTEESAHF